MINKTIKIAIDECGGQAKLAKLCSVAQPTVLLGFTVVVLVANTSRLSPKHPMEKSPKPTSCAHSQSHNSATNSKNLQEKGKVLMNSKDIQRTLHRDCKTHLAVSLRWHSR